LEKEEKKKYNKKKVPVHYMLRKNKNKILITKKYNNNLLWSPPIKLPGFIPANKVGRSVSFFDRG
jgi:hypothetical protein